MEKNANTWQTNLKNGDMIPEKVNPIQFCD